MKVILSGTACIGKSTIFEKLKEEFKYNNITFLNESARELLEQGSISSVGEVCSSKDQLYMLEEHYKNTLRYEKFISDRGALDGFVYATQSYLDGAYTFQQHKEHEELFLQCINDYTRIYYIPLESTPVKLVHDNVRLDSEEYRQQIDLMFKKTIKKYRLKNVWTLDQRNSVAELTTDIIYTLRGAYNLPKKGEPSE